MAIARGDTVRQCASETGRERGSRQENADSQADFVSEVEEGQQVGNTGSVASFKHAHEEPRGHHALEGEGGGLQRCGNAPAQDAEGCPHVRGDDFPHEREPLEDDVGDVEDGQQPLVLAARELEFRLHAGDFGVSA